MSLKQTDLLVKFSERSFNLNETLQLLKSKQLWFITWGVSNLTAYKDTVLFFKVSGMKFKGWVCISLAWNDTYTVNLVSSQWNLKETITDIYFDQLSEIIDQKIERITEYQR